MPDYRVYYIGDTGHFTGVEMIDCENDQEASERARHFAKAAPVELWQRDRLVATLNKAQKAG